MMNIGGWCVQWDCAHFLNLIKCSLKVHFSTLLFFFHRKSMNKHVVQSRKWRTFEILATPCSEWLQNCCLRLQLSFTTFEKREMFIVPHLLCASFSCTFRSEDHLIQLVHMYLSPRSDASYMDMYSSQNLHLGWFLRLDANRSAL